MEIQQSGTTRTRRNGDGDTDMTNGNSDDRRTEYSTVKGDKDVLEVAKRVFRDMAEEDWGAVKIGTTEGHLQFLAELLERDPEAVEYALKREGYDDLEELAAGARERYAASPEFDLLADLSEE